MTPELNTALIQQVLAHIDTNRDQWTQWQLVSGSPLKPAMCFAGRAYSIGTGENITNAGGLIIGNSQPIIETAQRLLGLTDKQRDRIFFYVRRRDRDSKAWVHISFPDLVARVRAETGYRYQPGDDGVPA